MALTFPQALPTSRAPRRITFEPLSSVGVSMSPFSFAQQTYVHAGEMWGGVFELGEMNRADGEEWAGFLAGLNGREGTFLLGDPLGASPRGTWSSPLVAGGSQTGKVLAIDGMSAGATGKRGDWFQLGSGATARLYKLTADFTANGSGQASIDFWPALRSSPSDNDPLTLTSAQGVFRLASNRRSWTLEDVRIGGIVVAFHEAL